MRASELYATALSLLLVSAVSRAAETAAPFVSGNSAAPECRDALRLAEATFYSNSFELFVPLRPADVSSSMVLGVEQADISVGEALSTDDSSFELFEAADKDRRIYIESGGSDRTRIGVSERRHNWRGDRYSLYFVPPGTGSRDFADTINSDPYAISPDSILDDSWRPPLVYRSPELQSLWILVVGEPGDARAHWTVLSGSDGNYRKSCTIRFSRHADGDAKRSLPSPVRRLASLLDQTLGTGKGEGTIQPTANLRTRADRIWTNLAIRPWALSESDAYNSAETVREGLTEWARKRPSFRTLHSRILETYPEAERALSAYYRDTFGISEAQAAASATWAIEIAFRANFVFPGGESAFGRTRDTATNPWPPVPMLFQ